MVQSVPEIHLFDARFKEHIGDADGARAALALCDPKTDSSFIQTAAAQANLERRLVWVALLHISSTWLSNFMLSFELSGESCSSFSHI